MPLPLVPRRGTGPPGPLVPLYRARVLARNRRARAEEGEMTPPPEVVGGRAPCTRPALEARQREGQPRQLGHEDANPLVDERDADALEHQAEAALDALQLLG